MDEAEINQIRNVALTLTLLYHYYHGYVDRNPCMTSSNFGDRWIRESLRGHPTQFANMFRMTKVIFRDLLNELWTLHGLHGSSRTIAKEVLAIILYILSQNESIREAMEQFQHSSETISRYFSVWLNVLVSLACEIVKPEDPTFQSIPTHVANDFRYMSFFKDCIGAIDRTHVDARISGTDKVAYIGRCGSPTQNVMITCDFNMCFTYVMAGWEGSTHDGRVFKFATSNRTYSFPYPPPDTKYHIPNFERSSGVARGKKEIFNKRHSSLRGVIERSFGVWKKKWVILRDMSSYPFPKQVQIVLATMALHNFIRRHHSKTDAEFVVIEEDLLQIPPEAFEYHVERTIPQLELDSIESHTPDGEGASEMVTLREQVANDRSLAI